MIIKLVVSVGLCLAAGFAGSLVTAPSVQTWYPTIVKPSYNPPDALFAPVWTALFVLMGIALFLVWKKQEVKPAQKSKAVIIFSIQLIVNISWSVVFFGLHSIAGALAVIIVLWILIVWTIVAFAKISPPAALFLVPYLFWVSFATVLNASLSWLNK